ncbi:MAG: hypothetical protein HKM24_03400 [Gammaproteobacteria bacterium]|nr:hypothetical protein [Gammaproteobacteria bacterium]
MFLQSLFYHTGRVFAYIAYALGPLALVQVIGNFKVLLSVFMGAGLSKVQHKTFREDITLRAMAYKTIGAGLMFFGLTLIILQLA